MSSKISWKHPNDNHGGSDKGRSAQDIVRDFFEAKGWTVIKSSREEDQCGIDFYIEAGEKKYSVAVCGTFYYKINKNHNRLIYSGYKTDKIPGVKHSKADIVVCYNSSNPDSLFVEKRVNILDWIEKNYKSSLEKENFCNKPEEILVTGLLQKRLRSETGYYDLWACIPLSFFRKVERPKESYKGLFD